MAGETHVALVIPAWNEPDAIGPVLEEIPPGVAQQVLVVVGGPADPTAKVAEAHGARVVLPGRSGYGAACWAGATVAMAAGAQIVVFLDGDHADPPAALPRLLSPLLDDRADLVLGCRDLSRFPDALPLHARAGNRLVLLLLRVTLGARFGDLPSFKVIRSEALHRLDMRERTYGWTVEMLVKADRAGLRIHEEAVEYRPRLRGRSKVAGTFGGSVRAAARLIGCVLAYATWRPAQNDQWASAGGP
jgi:glycosyltransferase involved in cell wall biosynthesis